MEWPGDENRGLLSVWQEDNNVLLFMLIDTQKS
jgi:hypothetical protein